MTVRTTALAALALAACQPPPEAPEGLDATTSYMVRNFWSDDATFQAGIQGFYDWFEDGGGKELVGACAGDECEGTTSKPTDAFTIADLTEDDVAALPIDDELVDDPGEDAESTDDDVVGPRNLDQISGVVSLAEMDCSWEESEQLLLRPDQNTVFPKDWESYERTYVTPRIAFEEGSTTGVYDAIPETIDPYAEGFDLTAIDATVMFTRNTADPTPLVGVDLPGYPLALEFRHGTWDVTIDGEKQQVSGFTILTYDPGAVWAPGGDNGLRQEFSIEINVERPGDKTLRMLAVWAEPKSPIIEGDSAFALNYAVNKSLKSSTLLSQICSGEVEVADEPAE